MRIQFARVMGIGRRIGLDEEKGFAVAVFLALLIVVAVIASFFAYSALTSTNEGYSTIYVLDANKKASDYPEVLIANQNSTFTVYVNVENHKNQSYNFVVQVKVVKNLQAIFPQNVQPDDQSIDFGNIKNDGEPIERAVTVTENTPGSYAVVFELYQNTGGTLTFTQNYCVLHIQVV